MKRLIHHFATNGKTRKYIELEIRIMKWSTSHYKTHSHNKNIDEFYRHSINSMRNKCSSLIKLSNESNECSAHNKQPHKNILHKSNQINNGEYKRYFAKITKTLEVNHLPANCIHTGISMWGILNDWLTLIKYQPKLCKSQPFRSIEPNVEYCSNWHFCV